MKIYLACPYSSSNKDTMLLRFRAACKYAGELMQQGYIVYSPLSHSVPIADQMDNHLDHAFWLRQDESFLEWADEIWVMDLPGWNQSKGVQYEIEWAIGHGREWRVVHV